MLKTYGVCELVHEKNAYWRIRDLSPHVAIAFKRLFPRVRQHDVVLHLSDNDDIRADLYWFMQRYPLEAKAMHLLKAGHRAVQERLARRGEILDPDWRPDPTKGIRAGESPYLYQSQAAKIAVDQGGLLLADEVGLGKTEASLTALASGAPLPAGIVVQSHLAHQWAERIEKFTTFTAHVIYSTVPYTLPPADIYIFRYTNIAGWIDFLKNGLLKSVIYDEIQELRTGTDSAKGRACSIVSDQARFKMGLTATATYNYGDEIHTVMQFLKKDLLGDREEFTREWCSYSGGHWVVKDPDALGEFLNESGWKLRRTEDDETVQQSMPKANVIPIEVDWNSQDAENDAAIMRALAMRVVEASSRMESMQASAQFDLRMRQMTGVAKARSVAAYVKMLLRDCERLLLTGWHRDVYTIWMRALAEFSPVLYTGSEDQGKKRRSVNAFTVGNSRVMIISNRSGAGLDGLQHYCRDIVHGEFDWSPQVHHQLTGRLRRAGQKHQVNAHYPWVNNGSDPVLMQINALKTDQARGIHDPGSAVPVRFTDESRIKILAQHVLDTTPAAPSPCGICGAPGVGDAKNIIPLSDADLYPEGPERDALFGPDNLWWLCADHQEAVLVA